MKYEPEIVHRYFNTSNGIEMVTFSTPIKGRVMGMWASFYDEWAERGYMWIIENGDYRPSNYEKFKKAETEHYEK